MENTKRKRRPLTAIKVVTVYPSGLMVIHDTPPPKPIDKWQRFWMSVNARQPRN